MHCDFADGLEVVAQALLSLLPHLHRPLMLDFLKPS